MKLKPAALTAQALLAVAASLALSCASPCPKDAFVDDQAGYCLVLPGGYKKASHNEKEGQEVYGFGPTGRMIMFLRRATEPEYTRIVNQINERRATPPDSVQIVEIGRTETAAWQIVQYKGQTTFETEYAFTDEKRQRFGRCTATYAKEREARDVLAACRTARLTR